MKKIIFLLAVISIYGIINSCTDTTANEEETYTISGHPDWKPIMFRMGDKISGAGADLADKILTELNIKHDLEYKGAWDQVQSMTHTGEVDMIVAAYKTAEREEYMEYSVPYTVDPVVIFVKKGKSFNFTTWSQLKGKKGIVTIGDSYGESFDKYLKDSLSTITVDTPELAFNKLTNGEADYFVYSLYAGEKAIIPLSGQFEYLPNYVTSENFYMTISKYSTLKGRMAEINTLIAKYKNDGTIDSLIKKYE